MNAVVLLLIWSLPLLLAVFAGQRHARWSPVIAPLPALLAAATLPVGTSVSLPWLLLGVELGVDDTARVFLGFSGLLWLAASLYAAASEAGDRDATRFRVFFLLAMSGNLGLIVAQDMVSFYLGFTLMGLAVYGLVAHPASRQAREAARHYLAWTIAGELLLFIAVVMLVAQNDGATAFEVLTVTPPADLVVLLLVIGFGIKLALPGLHFWLPRAYAVTPAPAVAVLSGAMIKAGLLGWLRFLPPGDAALAGWGQALMVVGVVGILFGAIVGLQQRRARLLLGYSSISKMGVLTAGMGAALTWPAAAPALIGALAVYAAHHALVKGALFLGLGLVERGGLRPWVLAGLGFLALALAGAPLTSGALAKSVLTASLPAQAQPLLLLLSVSALATTLLMARFLFLVWKPRGSVALRPAPQAAAAWLALLALVAMFPFALGDIGRITGNAAPVLLGALVAALGVLAAVGLRARGSIPRRRPVATPPAVQARRWMRRTICAAQPVTGALRSVWQRAYQQVGPALGHRWLQRRPSDDDANHWPLAGSLWLGVGGLLLAALGLAA